MWLRPFDSTGADPLVANVAGDNFGDPCVVFVNFDEPWSVKVVF